MLPGRQAREEYVNPAEWELHHQLTDGSARIVQYVLFQAAFSVMIAQLVLSRLPIRRTAFKDRTGSNPVLVV